MDYASNVPSDINKCPIHRTWISTQRSNYKAKVRWCELCRIELDNEKKRQAKAAGAPPKQQLKIIKL